MKKALIVSLNFNPGHASHLVASYYQCEELGYETMFYIHSSFKPYLPISCNMVCFGEDPCPKVDFAFILFPSQKNLSLINRLKHQGSRIIYVFHEPLAPMREYKDAGFSCIYLAKLCLINFVNTLTVKWSNAIILPSKKAIRLYQDNPRYQNQNFHYIPLLFDDERTSESSQVTRCYFSYIGTVAADHSFNEYLSFVIWAIENNRMPELRFLIATKSKFEVPLQLVNSPRVFISQGKSLSNSEINCFYASSYVIWNAYARTTQSGVLAKSFMFGTPAVVLRKNLSEFADDGQEVIAIDDNCSFKEIEFAIRRIMSDFSHFSSNARKRFESVFFYKNYNNIVKEILLSLQDE